MLRPVLINSNYVQTGEAIYKLSNFTENYDARADRYSIVNYSAEYASTGFKVSNFTTLYENQAYFKIANLTNLGGPEATNNSNIKARNADLTNLSVTDNTNVSIGNFTIIQFNSSCVGFGINNSPTAGKLLACTQ